VKFKNFNPVFLIDDGQLPELHLSGAPCGAARAQFDRHFASRRIRPTGTRKKKTPFRGPLNFFCLNDLLILFLFHLVDQGFKSVIEGLFERLGRTFYEEVMLGNMNSDLRNLVFDGVNYIVQLQEHINFDNSVMERV
jgi:hypothetical protein